MENESSLDNTPPIFHLESQEPVFAVGGLKDSTEYRVYVTPVNMKGVGQPQDPQGTLVRTNTEPKPLIEDPKNEGPGGGGGKGFLDGGDGDGLNPLMVMIFGGATGLVLILVTITLVAKLRCGRNGNGGAGGNSRLSRDNSKVLVVTTIADMEFSEDSGKHGGGGDRLILNAAASDGADHRHDDVLYVSAGGSGCVGKRRPYMAGEGGGGGMSSGYIRLPPDQQQQPLDYPSYLMYPPPSGQCPNNTAAAATSNYCTMRKHSLQQYEATMAVPNGEGMNNMTATATAAAECGMLTGSHGHLMEPQQQQHDEDDMSSPRELLLQMSMRDKHRAGFMYGTLRLHQQHPGRHQQQLPPPQFGNNSHQAAASAAVMACRGDELGGGGGSGGVVPPPPMFEEGVGLIPRTAAAPGSGTLKKCAGKPEKKDKMESRV